MFTNDQRQKERTGKYGSPRLEYLQELVTQFQNATSGEIKEKIVANLGNFAYDPYNYTFLRQSPMRGSWSLPLEEFAMLVQMQQMLKSSFNVMGFLLSFNAYPVLLGTRDEILRPEIVDAIKRFAAAGAVNVGFSNLAQAFLDKHVSELN
ncbi:UNVERIFIED_CONTAM: hypothetical protein Scaly_2646400 [Sesamum calycinum]|uniref:Uncharacterized protein n=1 Tax=Sesamum calycinum TaxID=2727403 RepID=A0AAW2J8Y9_9LAMI